MAAVMNQLLAAMNAHDLDAFVACFAPEYHSEQPAHPSRTFDGRDQVRVNWARVFAGVRDFSAELVASASTDDGIEMREWHWSGTHTTATSGTPA
jgi:hypothetical protein